MGEVPLYGAYVHFKTLDGEITLHAALKSAHSEMGRIWIDKGANIRAKMKTGDSPLHCGAGAEQGDDIILQLLLNRGADRCAPVRWGGADPNSKTRDGARSMSSRRYG